jgi:hypothetical protein
MDDTHGAPVWQGMFPDDTRGPMAVEHWAVVLGVDEKRVRDLLREHNVPRRKIGARLYVRASDLWSAFKYVED